MTVQDISAFESRGAPLRGSAIEPGYMAGFGNKFETEALPGALPTGHELAAAAPLRPLCRAVLGLALYCAAGDDERSWLYRIRPSVKHSGRYRSSTRGSSVRRPGARRERSAIGQLRWDPIPIPGEELTF